MLLQKTGCGCQSLPWAFHQNHLMSIPAKRDVLRSLDYLLYCHFVYLYFLDASLFLFCIRMFLQLVSSQLEQNSSRPCSQQLLSPRSFARSLRTALGIVTAGYLGCLLMHLTFEPGQPGILIDFIGNQQLPTTMRLITLDSVVYIGQIIRIFISSSLSQTLVNSSIATTLAVPPALVPALGSDRITLMLPSERTQNEENCDDLFYHPGLVVDISLRSSVRNVMYADMEDPHTARDGSDRLPV
ncbi:hypothetical protein J3Q64DRAFT_1701468 [Phycomyces blakesleeanus]|uniref:DUF1746 domain-containing protein n=2 Tax=Phycomyces blakesleeanus TaxID=4837 RepID=A0A162TK75_PHYB8|nr:hypothetical protein PHYBLDRAFT_66791 [Phycomyces blakesleeanus NRRL 1555(-)]OAD69242.1 hypothetical protein PHYBLDRAFT_66791 [Phycomyces blakesleeanus NRRL 1555(-)]|eukprot:XP_018287282.1 hypothetical protein PHYBLDRAFT_66791 [Phycomyces blakesleeanus NRRL 1555(-)]